MQGDVATVWTLEMQGRNADGSIEVHSRSFESMELTWWWARYLSADVVPSALAESKRGWRLVRVTVVDLFGGRWDVPNTADSHR